MLLGRLLPAAGCGRHGAGGRAEGEGAGVRVCIPALGHRLLARTVPQQLLGARPWHLQQHRRVCIHRPSIAFKSFVFVFSPRVADISGATGRTCVCVGNATVTYTGTDCAWGRVHCLVLACAPLVPAMYSTDAGCGWTRVRLLRPGTLRYRPMRVVRHARH